MKTPLQELIDRLDYLIELSNDMLYEFGLRAAKNEAKSMLEKEKEVIIMAYETGDKYKTETPGECYYNKIFNTK
jgi:hypothetical protein